MVRQVQLYSLLDVPDSNLHIPVWPAGNLSLNAEYQSVLGVVRGKEILEVPVAAVITNTEYRLTRQMPFRLSTSSDLR